MVDGPERGWEEWKIWLLSDILKSSGIKDAQKLVSFDMSDLDRPDKSRFNEVADEAAQAASGTRPVKDEEQRDSAWLRWVKLFSIIFVPAIVLGVLFALADYVCQYTATTQFGRAVARGFVETDTWNWMRTRFVVGACLGAASGLLYVIRCSARMMVP
jgi:hypothetical protein